MSTNSSTTSTNNSTMFTNLLIYKIWYQIITSKIIEYNSIVRDDIDREIKEDIRTIIIRDNREILSINFIPLISRIIKHPPGENECKIESREGGSRRYN